MPNTSRPAPSTSGSPRAAAHPAPAEGRRHFLRLLALAPAAAAGCAAARGAPAALGGKASAPPPPAGHAPADPLAPLREAPLPADAEPALVFRAAPARPGE